MKAIIVVDIPVDESHEIDSYGMVADLDIYPEIPTIRKELSFKLKHVDIEPIPKYYPSTSNPQRIEYLKQLGMTEKEQHYYELGHDDCIDEILEEEE